MGDLLVLVLILALLAYPFWRAWNIRRHTLVTTTLDQHELEDVFASAVGKLDSTFRSWQLYRAVDPMSGHPAVEARGPHGAIRAAIHDEGELRHVDIWMSEWESRSFGLRTHKTGTTRRRIRAFANEIRRRDPIATTSKS